MRAADGLLALGLDIQRYSTGSYRLPCPGCAKGKKDEAFSLKVEPDGKAVWLCFRCGLKGAGRSSSGSPGSQLPPAAPAVPAKPAAPDHNQLKRALATFRAAQAIAPDDDAGRYLTARGCLIPPAGSHLRWLPCHRHPRGHVGPALIALATHAVTGAPQTLHRTWIDPSRPGEKAVIDKYRLLFRGLPKAGAVIRLFPDEAVLDGLAVGEGIENCLIAAQGSTPVWSTLDAGNLAAFPVLDGIESLTIVADHDEAGLKAAATCCARWHRAGRDVRYWYPPVPGDDAADFVARRAA